MIIGSNLHDFSRAAILAINAALKAGDILRYGFYGHYKIKEKEGILNLVTEYDLLSEKSIIDSIKSEYPDAAILSEECGKIAGNGELWIIDPLDGTVNFAHHIPVFAVSIALRVEKEVALGVIYQPMTGELFVAEKGRGAYLNGKKIIVSQTKLLEKSLLAAGLPYDLISNPNSCVEKLAAVLKSGFMIRRLGAAAIDLAFVAAGRFEAFFETSLKPWDCAAGVLLIEEAGGKVTDWENGRFDLFESKTILCGNPEIHKQMVKLWQ